MNVNAMKTMVCACMLLGATSVFAQTDATTGATTRTEQWTRRKMDPAKMAERQTERMAKELSLTTEQKAKVLDIAKKYAAQKPSKDSFTKRNEEIEAVLTSDQKTKFAEMKKKGPRQHNGSFKRKSDNNADNALQNN